MVSTPSPYLGVDLQATGDNVNTWGVRLNNNVFKLLEDAVCKATRVAIVSTSTILTSAPYVTNQVRSIALVFTGTLTANSEVIVPAVDKPWMVRNETTGNFTLTIKTGAGAGVALSKDCWIPVFADSFPGNVVDWRTIKWGYQRLQEIQDADANSPHDAMNRQTTLSIPVNSFAGATGDLNMGGFRITNLGVGNAGSTDAVNAQQLDAAIANAVTPVSDPGTVRVTATDLVPSYLAEAFEPAADVVTVAGDQRVIPILSGNSLYLWSTCV